jgi:hypothetical protein
MDSKASEPAAATTMPGNQSTNKQHMCVAVMVGHVIAHETPTMNGMAL